MPLHIEASFLQLVNLVENVLKHTLGLGMEIFATCFRGYLSQRRLVDARFHIRLKAESIAHPEAAVGANANSVDADTFLASYLCGRRRRHITGIVTAVGD